MENQPLINILVRTSNREKGFSRMMHSIQRQTYRNIKVIICCDTDIAPVYVPEKVVSYLTLPTPTTFISIESFPVTPHPDKPYGYNLYCNDLKARVTEGYYFFLDDDDILDSPDCIERIIPDLHPSRPTICRFRRGDIIKGRSITRGKIGMPCIVVPASLRNAATFTDKGHADYLYIRDMASKYIPVYSKVVLVNSPVRSRGAMEGCE